MVWAQSLIGDGADRVMIWRADSGPPAELTARSRRTPATPPSPGYWTTWEVSAGGETNWTAAVAPADTEIRSIPLGWRSRDRVAADRIVQAHHRTMGRHHRRRRELPSDWSTSVPRRGHHRADRCRQDRQPAASTWVLHGRRRGHCARSPRHPADRWFTNVSPDPKQHPTHPGRPAVTLIALKIDQPDDRGPALALYDIRTGNTPPSSPPASTTYKEPGHCSAAGGSLPTLFRPHLARGRPTPDMTAATTHQPHRLGPRGWRRAREPGRSRSAHPQRPPGVMVDAPSTALGRDGHPARVVGLRAHVAVTSPTPILLHHPAVYIPPTTTPSPTPTATPNTTPSATAPPQPSCAGPAATLGPTTGHHSLAAPPAAGGTPGRPWSR